MSKVYDSMLTISHHDNGLIDYYIKPEDIYEFFSKTDNIIIPDYQRPYSWEESHVKALLDDIIVLEEGKSWFMGPIFTAEPPRSSFLHLLDGQQRVTTLQLLLREIFLFEFYFEEGFRINLEQNEEFIKYRSHRNDIFSCLLKNEGGNKSPKFSTEITAKEFFRDFIKSIILINNKTTYLQVNKEFKEKARNLKKNSGSRTAFNLFERNNDVIQYLNVNFFDLNDPDAIFIELNKFISNLLYRLWIIKIPLRKTSYSTNIFESINNRGKELSLIDKLKFKTLTKYDSDNDEIEIQHLNEQWKKIFKLIDESVKGNDASEKNRFFKKEDDFFNVFFNSIDGEDLKEEEKLNKFEKKYLTSKDQVNNFLEQVINVLEFLKLIYSPTESHEFNAAVYDLTNDLPEKKKEARNRSMALLRLTRNMISTSDNSRYLIFNLIIKTGTNYNAVVFVLLNSLWNINKIVFYDEIWQNDKSNEIRPRYLKYINKKVNLSNINEFFHPSRIENNEENTWYKRQKIQEINPINYIINNNNDASRYAIYFTTFLINYSALNFGNETAYNDTDLEHIIPEKWKPNNNNIRCTTEDLAQPLTDLLSLNEYGQDLKNCQKDLLNKFAALEDFDIKDQTNAPKGSIIQFIGNKMVLSQGENRSLGNNSFSIKFEVYKVIRTKIMVPSFDFSKIGISNYQNNFGLKEILQRSLYLVDIIHKNYNLTLDEVNK